MQEFHIPSSRKDSFAGPPPQSVSDDGSGSASGSGDESGDSQDNDQQPQVVGECTGLSNGFSANTCIEYRYANFHRSIDYRSSFKVLTSFVNVSYIILHYFAFQKRQSQKFPRNPKFHEDQRFIKVTTSEAEFPADQLNQSFIQRLI